MLGIIKQENGTINGTINDTINGLINENEKIILDIILKDYFRTANNKKDLILIVLSQFYYIGIVTQF